MQTSSSTRIATSIGFTALAALATAQMGCSAGEGPEDVQETTSALTAGQSACIIGSQGVRIGDRSRTQSLVAAGTLLDVGLDARLSSLQQPNDVRVNGNAILRDRSTVEGNLTVSGTLTRAASAIVTGTLTTGTPVTVPALLVKTVTPGSTNVDIPNDTTTTLNPGNYGDIIIRARARVTVSGTYNVRSLLVEPDVTLFQATFAGPVLINSAGAVTIGDRTSNSLVTATVTSFQVYSSGNVTFGNSTSFSGIVSAPLGDLTIRSRSQLNGCAGGRTIGFDPDVVQIVNDVTASPPLRPAGKLVFITSTVHLPDFGSAAAADTVCQQRAVAAGHSGTYRAWLSDANSSPNTRFTRSAEPYRLVNGTTVADNYADLTDGSLDAVIDLTEFGTTPPIVTGDLVYTGTTAQGNVVVPTDFVEFGATCDNWTFTITRTDTKFGARGNYTLANHTLPDQAWSYGGGRIICGFALPIYCMQQ